MTTSCPLLSKTPLGAKCCALGKRIFGYFCPQRAWAWIPYLNIGMESGLAPDSGLFSWDWAGAWLQIRGESGQQEQRSASATPWRASSMCSPQPDQVGFLQISQVTFEHICCLLYLAKFYDLDLINLNLKNLRHLLSSLILLSRLNLQLTLVWQWHTRILNY